MQYSCTTSVALFILDCRLKRHCLTDPLHMKQGCSFIMASLWRIRQQEFVPAELQSLAAKKACNSMVCMDKTVKIAAVSETNTKHCIKTIQTAAADTCTTNHDNSKDLQGSHGYLESWKTWNFQNLVSRPGKRLEFDDVLKTWNLASEA